jgi:hypothetical protein
MSASVKTGNLELASKLENSHKELQSSVEQKMKESNDKMREEIRRDGWKIRNSGGFRLKLLNCQVRQLQSDNE